jgi:hypothetical protein
VSASGRRTFSLLYRIRGRSRRHPLGVVGIVSLVDAREEARRFLARLQLGHDPVAEKAAPTVGSILAEYLAEHTLDPKTVQAGKERIARLGGWKDRPVSGLDPQEVRRLVRDVSSAPVSQNRMLSQIKAAIRWASREGRKGRGMLGRSS